LAIIILLEMLCLILSSIQFYKMTFTQHTSKEDIFEKTKNFIIEKNMSIAQIDDKRPWGGFFVIDETNADTFIETFFPHLTKEILSISGKLSPKILLVAPQKRLSWQYHYRRAEIWKLIGGEAAVVTSDDDEENETIYLQKGDIIELKQGERHRLVGTDNWGIVAEIWRHTDADNPSDENDIVRLQDDFGR
jgi:mannose-6-phosphate isomerase